MHIGSHYTFKEVIFWTRRDLYGLLIITTIPTILYAGLGWKWLALPWLPIALLGTAVAFVVGFKNNASYDRTWEARKIWGAIVNISRSWGISVKDYVTNKHATTKLTPEELKAIHLTLYQRHFAWLTALRFQLREPRTWEAIYKAHNAEYKNKWFTIEEHTEKLEDHLKKYLSESEFNMVMSKSNKASQIIALQSAHLRALYEQGYIEDFRHMELQKILTEQLNQQGASERIKNFPYPRQYATINLWFIKLFVLLLPLGMLKEFDAIGASLATIPDFELIGKNLIWLTIPFSTLSGWIFTTMEKIGEASENPFEGSANDIPITSMSRMIEIDLLQMLDAENIPQPVQPFNNIIN